MPVEFHACWSRALTRYPYFPYREREEKREKWREKWRERDRDISQEFSYLVDKRLALMTRALEVLA